VAARRFGQYVLEEKIGEGGMGAVYRARHALLRRPTAVKLVHPDKAGADTLARFEREVQLTASLTHPNTVHIYDYGRTPDGIFYYAMEYLDGVDLEELVRRFGPQDPSRVVHILAQVAGSLSEAHSIGLVHRDIKPANIVLCERGGVADTAKVVDFGLVKDVNSTAVSPSLSRVNAVIGTPLYMSPEALLAPNEIDARADLYALGAVGYYLLTGTTLFEGSSMIEIGALQLHGTPVRLSERLGRALPPDLEALILACVAKKADERPASACALREALEACNVPRWTPTKAREWWDSFGDRARSKPPDQKPESTPALRTLSISLDARPAAE
jgi:eukaryotic-like serine/threonine-protein kinase